MFCPRCASEVPDDARVCSSCGLDLGAITEIARKKEAEQPDELAMVSEALKGEYEIVKELGRGGMAIVYLARDLNLERDVAIKVLPLSMVYDNEFVARFQREAKTAAKLEHPNIISIYRVGKTGRVIYFVMKYLRGKSLADVVETRGALPPEEIRSVMVEAADALGYAHENGVVHRDIKPDNIVFDEKGRAIITDFGIAKAATGTRLTGTGMAIGTPYYMSPEQARAQDLDGRSDIYSLGVVAYQCLTGRVPFEGEDSFAVGIKHISEELPVPELDTDEQRALFDIVAKMLEKDPGDRFQSTDELVSALRAGASTMATQAMSPSDPAVPRVATPQPQLARPSTPTTPLPSAGAPATTAAPAAKKLNPLVLAVIGVLVIGGGGAVLWSTRSGTDADGAGDQSPEQIADAGTEADRETATGADTQNGQPESAETIAADDTSMVEAAAEEPAPEASEAEETPPAEPEPQPERPRVDPRRTAWLEETRTTLARITRQIQENSRGFERVGNPIIGTAPRGGSGSHTLTLRGGAGREYVFVGFCDGSCTDVDLVLHDPRGDVLDSDYAVDERPVLQVRPPEIGEYRLEVPMPSCTANNCYYTVAVYARDRVVERKRQ